MKDKGRMFHRTIGIDHGFSFRMRYFERHGLAPDWDVFLKDFCTHWPTDAPAHPCRFRQGRERRKRSAYRRLSKDRAVFFIRPFGVAYVRT